MCQGRLLVALGLLPDGTSCRTVEGRLLGAENLSDCVAGDGPFTPADLVVATETHARSIRDRGRSTWETTSNLSALRLGGLQRVFFVGGGDGRNLDSKRFVCVAWNVRSTGATGSWQGSRQAGSYERCPAGLSTCVRKDLLSAAAESKERTKGEEDDDGARAEEGTSFSARGNAWGPRSSIGGSYEYLQLE